MSKGVCSDPIKKAEHYNKISKALKGKPKSPDHRQNLSESRIRKGCGRREKNWNWKGEKVPFKCTICGKEIQIKVYEKDTRKTCGSKECFKSFCKIRSVGKGNPNYKPRTKKTCPICGKVFTDSQKHAKARVCCSTKCMGKRRSIITLGEKNHRFKPKIKINCTECGKIMERLQSEIDRNNKHGTFCSKQCKDIWTSKHICFENHPNWQGGMSFEPYCVKFDKKRRTAVREFFNYKCIACGSNATEFRRNLHVHHIDHDKEQGCNGKPFNLIPLCHHCHSKEPSRKKEYILYITKTLEEGFKWGIWSRAQYATHVMYPG